MSYDRDQYAASQADKQHERAAQMLPMARILAGAAPLMDRMTNSDEWNRYLSYLQGIQNRLTAQKDVAASKLADPAIWATEDLLKMKSDVLQAQVGVDLLNLVIGLPKAIMEGAEKANSLIAQFEAKSEAAGQPKP